MNSFPPALFPSTSLLPAMGLTLPAQRGPPAWGLRNIKAGVRARRDLCWRPLRGKTTQWRRRQGVRAQWGLELPVESSETAMTVPISKVSKPSLRKGTCYRQSYDRDPGQMPPQRLPPSTQILDVSV